jgi:mycoredoxin
VTASKYTSDSIKIFGTLMCGDCYRARHILDTLDIPYDFIDIHESEQARAYVQSINRGNQSVPTILFPDGSTITEPSGDELVIKLNKLTKPA